MYQLDTEEEVADVVDKLEDLGAVRISTLLCEDDTNVI